METFMNGAIAIEAVLLSFLVAVWMTWMGLRGLFRLLPLTTQAVKSIQFVPGRQQENRRCNAA